MPTALQTVLWMPAPSLRLWHDNRNYNSISRPDFFVDLVATLHCFCIQHKNSKQCYIVLYCICTLVVNQKNTLSLQYIFYQLCVRSQLQFLKNNSIVLALFTIACRMLPVAPASRAATQRRTHKHTCSGTVCDVAVYVSEAVSEA